VSIHGGSDVAAGHSLAGCPTGVSGVASLQVRGTPEWTPQRLTLRLGGAAAVPGMPDKCVLKSLYAALPDTA
jgi:hypothetical protein